MVADLREMQENQWVSEIQIDKLRFSDILTNMNLTRSVLQLQHGDDFVAIHFAIFNKA